MKKKSVFAILIAMLFALSVRAQHCIYDGSVVMVLDIRNLEDGKPVPGLDVRLTDRDSSEYYQAVWKYTRKTKYPYYDADYMRFVYVTEEMMEELRETGDRLPGNVLHKYILWLGPQVYRNAYGKNRELKLYLTDLAKINIKKNGLTYGSEWITLTDSVFWNGCTASDLWHGKPDGFRKVFFSPDQISNFEKRPVN